MNTADVVKQMMLTVAAEAGWTEGYTLPDGLPVSRFHILAAVLADLGITSDHIHEWYPLYDATNFSHEEGVIDVVNGCLMMREGKLPVTKH